MKMIEKIENKSKRKKGHKVVIKIYLKEDIEMNKTHTHTHKI